MHLVQHSQDLSVSPLSDQAACTVCRHSSDTRVLNRGSSWTDEARMFRDLVISQFSAFLLVYPSLFQSLLLLFISFCTKSPDHMTQLTDIYSVTGHGPWCQININVTNNCFLLKASSCQMLYLLFCIVFAEKTFVMFVFFAVIIM